MTMTIAPIGNEIPSISQLFSQFRVAVTDNFDKVHTELVHDLQNEWLPFQVELPKGDLFDIFIAELPEEHRQHHRCSACRMFFNKYGGMVYVSKSGDRVSPIWDIKEDYPELYSNAVQAVKNYVLKQNLDTPFLGDASGRCWGVKPEQGDAYKHLHVIPIYHSMSVDKSKIGELKAAHRHQNENLQRSVAKYAEYSDKVAGTALKLKTGAYYYVSSIANWAKWFSELLATLNETKHIRKRYDIMHWHTARVHAWCSVSNSSLGTLLDDVISGEFDEVEINGRFKAKVHGGVYQRPVAAPTAANLKRAEEIIIEKGLMKSLERRFAKLEEIPMRWTPNVSLPKTLTSTIFGKIKLKDAKESVSSEITIGDGGQIVDITWNRFEKTVLPSVAELFYYVPSGKSNFCALLNAVHQDSPPIFKWDHHISAYGYVGGSYGSTWGLTHKDLVRVTGIANDVKNIFSKEESSESVILFLEGARDQMVVSNHAVVGLGLFPSTLLPELHEVRATIEQFSGNSNPAGIEESTANGVVIRDGCNEILIIKDKAGEVSKYRITNFW